MSDNFFINVLIIVILQAILLFLYHFTRNKYEKKADPLNERLEIISAILASTKHEKILTLEKIVEIELKSKAVFVFSKDILRDVNDSGQFSNESHSVGTFYPTVKKNLARNDVHYTYFLKQDSHWKHFVYSFSDSYKSIKNIDNKVMFFMIPAEKYFFYDEIYLYQDHNGIYSAFEFLPSISDEEERVLYYLELGDKQIERLVQIKETLQKSYQGMALNKLVDQQVN